MISRGDPEERDQPIVRCHKVKMVIEYEGEPLPTGTLERFHRTIGDMFSRMLGNREVDDNAYVSGLAQEIDTHLTER